MSNAHYRFPPELWTAPLIGTMLLPLDTGSVYDTSITLDSLSSFLASPEGGGGVITHNDISDWDTATAGFLLRSNDLIDAGNF